MQTQMQQQRMMVSCKGMGKPRPVRCRLWTMSGGRDGVILQETKIGKTTQFLLNVC
jgi:hypothetical protein